MKSKKIIFIFFCILVFISSCAAGKKLDFAKKDTRTMLAIKSSGIGSEFYNAGISLAYILNNNMPDMISYNSIWGVSENEKIASLENGSADLVFISGPEAYMAYTGYPDFWDHPQAIKALFGFVPTVYNCIVSEESGIKEMQDLRGKRIVLNSVNTVSGNLLENLLRLNGITGMNTEIFRARESIGEKMLKRGEVDAMWYSIGNNHCFFRDLEVPSIKNRKYSIIPCSEENNLKAFLSVYPVFYTEPFISGELKCSSSLVAYSCLACSDHLDEEQAYNITKLWFENIDYINQFIPGYDKESAISYLKNVPLPFHPGAARFLRESGFLD